MAMNSIPEAWLVQDSPEALAEAIKRRIQGELGPRPGRDEWTWTEPVLSMVERSTEEPERSRVSKAILLLLKELAGISAKDLLKEEWPAGLLLLARRVLWSGEEKKELGIYAAELLKSASCWPIGQSSGPGLGSPALEAYRFARFVNLRSGCCESLEGALRRLSQEYGLETEERAKEEGALIGLLASYEGMEERALQRLRDMSGARRDWVFRALVSEYEGWKGPGEELAPTLLGQYDKNERRADWVPPTREDQRWAARAAMWSNPTLAMWWP